MPTAQLPLCRLLKPTDMYIYANQPLKVKEGEIRLSSFSIQNGAFVGTIWLDSTSKSDGIPKPFKEKFELLLPFSMPVFGLGYHPYRPFIHPTDLDPADPDFLVWVNDEKGIVRRNRDGHTFKLELDPYFSDNGIYRLLPADSSQAHYMLHAPRISEKDLLDTLQQLMKISFKTSEVFEGAVFARFLTTFKHEDADYAELEDVDKGTQLKDLEHHQKKVYRSRQISSRLLQKKMKPRAGMEYDLKVYYAFDNFTTGTIPVELLII